MRKFLSTAILAAGFGTMATAGDKPMVVVELFTSQGCSSCPPADKMLTNLAQYEDVIALGLHVDYWDYLGWKDKFAVAAHSNRQKVYNAILPSKYRLVTPQMIVHGKAQVAGGSSESKDRINLLVSEARALKDRADLKLTRKGSRLIINLSSKSGNLGRASVHLVKFLPAELVKIQAGENRGRDVTYTNIVRDLKTIATWDGQAPKTLSYTLQKDGSYAVIVQEKKQGSVLAARKLP